MGLEKGRRVSRGEKEGEREGKEGGGEGLVTDINIVLGRVSRDQVGFYEEGYIWIKEQVDGHSYVHEYVRACTLTCTHTH